MDGVEVEGNVDVGRARVQRRRVQDVNVDCPLSLQAVFRNPGTPATTQLAGVPLLPLPDESTGSRSLVARCSSKPGFLAQPG
jgi:hypothetical protein